MTDTENKPPRPAWGPPANFRRRVPDGDSLERLVCDDCGFVAYENPKLVVGAVCVWEDRILFGKRSIHPRKGYWTLPAGFMEMRETMAEGAAREAWEETCARIEIDALIGLYDIPRIGQIHVMYRARLLSPDVAPGVESLEVALFRWDEIPWKELAFPTSTWALDHWRETKDLKTFAPFGSPPDYQGLR